MIDKFPKLEQLKENYDLYDLDIFLYDNTKIIHITTAGMELINSLSEMDFNPIQNFRKILSYRRVFNYTVLSEVTRDNLTSEDDYLSFFNFIAKRGFYSYDKVDIDDSENYIFQLIAKPVLNRRIFIPDLNITLGNIESKEVLNYDLKFLRAKKDFPEKFEYFDISEYI